jgi:branched-chain amino acid transport system ATP-binding protein
MGSSDQPPVLRLEGIRKNFGGFTALSGVGLDLEPGSVHAVIGPNGAGKTTLLQVLTGVFPPTAGRVWLNGTDVTRWPPWKRVRAGLGRSFQVAHLFEQMTVEQSIAVAAAAGSRRRTLSAFRPARPAEREAVQYASEVCDLAQMHDRVVGELSHGDRKRVELALVLAARPRVLLLDEPTAGMSRGESVHMTSLFAELSRDHGISMLLIEHDMEVVGALADRVTALDFGEVIFSGKPDEMASSEALRLAYFGQPRATWAVGEQDGNAITTAPPGSTDPEDARELD